MPNDSQRGGQRSELGLMALAIGANIADQRLAQQEYDRQQNELARNLSQANSTAEALRKPNTFLQSVGYYDQSGPNPFALQQAYGDSRARVTGSPMNPVQPARPPSVPMQASPYGTQPPVVEGQGYMSQSESRPGQAIRNTWIGPGGQIMSSGGPQRGGFVQGVPAPVPVDANTQGKQAYLESLRGQLPADQYNAAQVAAMSPGVNMSQFIDDVRQAIPDLTTKPKSLSERSAERRQQDLAELDAIVGTSDPFVAKSYAVARYGLDPLITSESAAMQFLQSQRAGLSAIDSSMGSASTQVGENNPVRVQSRADYDRLRPGDSFVDPGDGKVYRKQ